MLPLLLPLLGCGQDRYIVASGSSDNRWSEMMDCRHRIWADRGGPARAALTGMGAGLGGAIGGAAAGVAGADTNPEKYSDAVDRCMAGKGYLASRPNPFDHR